jgi:homoserine dehydrogenase
LVILSRMIPSLRSVLPHGFRSVKIDSLVPKEYSLVPDAESYLALLTDLDSQYNDLRKRAAGDGKVLRYVGVIDVGQSHIQASLQE